MPGSRPFRSPWPDGHQGQHRAEPQPAETHSTWVPRPASKEAKAPGRQRSRQPAGQHQPALTLAIPAAPNRGQRQRSARDGQHAIARAVQQRKARRRRGPSSISSVAASGCMQAATRPDTSGCRRRSTPNSSKRAATWAGPIKLPASTTPAADTPAAPAGRQVRGECRAGEGHHRKHPDQQGDGDGLAGPWARKCSQRMGCLRPGHHVDVMRRPRPGAGWRERQTDQQMQRRPGPAGAAQPRLCSSAAVVASPRCWQSRRSGDARDGTACLAAVEPGEGGKGCVVQAGAHADAQQQPGRAQTQRTLRQASSARPSAK